MKPNTHRLEGNPHLQREGGTQAKVSLQMGEGKDGLFNQWHWSNWVFIWKILNSLCTLHQITPHGSAKPKMRSHTSSVPADAAGNALATYTVERAPVTIRATRGRTHFSRQHKTQKPYKTDEQELQGKVDRQEKPQKNKFLPLLLKTKGQSP